ncbi:MAG: hypothetical protein JXB48_06015 [Candidatus Latescibacteria bacterium]|nr:hypothetical protein [Candidatus Latescibacterota bacterium]
MAISQNRLLAYTFLAAINDTKRHDDLLEIFIPLIKRAFNVLFEKRIDSGLIKDLKEAVDSIYDLLELSHFLCS